jgi:hypothetical protein
MNDIFSSIWGILTHGSRKKILRLSIIPNWNFKLNNEYYDFLDVMLSAFLKQINAFSIKPINILTLRNIFRDFDKSFNNVIDSKFQMDISKMEGKLSIGLNVNKDIIKLHFLYGNTDDIFGYISAIVHAINTFCHLFTFNYDGLNIYVCLDNNRRNLSFPKHYNNYNDIFEHLHRLSSAFGISGVTQRSEKKIILTKSEEIIKLLYHELAHFVGLDERLIGIKSNLYLDIDKTYLNISESYIELLSVILNSMYQTIHISGIIKMDRYLLLEKILQIEFYYSIFLSSIILKFYGYNKDTFRNFFQRHNKKNNSPIPIWEYIILRSQLFCNINKISILIKNNWKVINPHIVVKMAEIDDNFLDKLSVLMDSQSLSNISISYMMVDLNWNFI